VEAWDDVERAVVLAPNTNVFTLAGVIAYDRKDLETAKDRFQRARAADGNNCTAHSYYALVHATQNNWSEATPVFALATTCFARAGANLRRELEEIEGGVLRSGVQSASRCRSREEHQRKRPEGGTSGL
jgi:hypothetical protein